MSPKIKVLQVGFLTYSGLVVSLFCSKVLEAVGTVSWSHACFCNSPSKWILRSLKMCVYVIVCVLVEESEGLKWWSPSLPLSSTTVHGLSLCCCQTLVMEARQFDDFWSFSGCVVGGSGMARKLKGSPILLVPMWPGLSAGLCRLLLSTMLDVLDARLSRVLHKRQQRVKCWLSRCNNISHIVYGIGGAWLEKQNTPKIKLFSSISCRAKKRGYRLVTEKKQDTFPLS